MSGLVFAVNIPTFGSPHAFACERANRLFCWNWLRANWGPVLWPALKQHVVLTVVAVGIGFVISTALALLAYRRSWVEKPVLTVTAVLYTIPALALFELLLPLTGLTLTTAEIALVAYTLLILFRNTLTGLRNVSPEVKEAAAGMGMTPRQQLLRVELPLALPAIVAGLRIATVTVVALATIAALVCDQGLGVPILTAISNDVFKTELISAGVLAVALSLIADGLLVLLQRAISPWSRIG
jgi:osmoprotectant transport system permease protein